MTFGARLVRDRLALAFCTGALAWSGCAGLRSPNLGHQGESGISFAAETTASRLPWPFTRTRKSQSAGGSAPEVRRPLLRKKPQAESTEDRIAAFLESLDSETHDLLDEELLDVQPEKERERFLVYLSTVEPDRVRALLLTRRQHRLERERQQVKAADEQDSKPPEVQLTAGEAKPRKEKTKAKPTLTLSGTVEELAPEQAQSPQLATPDQMIEMASSPPLQTAEISSPDAAAPTTPSALSRLKQWTPGMNWLGKSPAPEAEPAPPQTAEPSGESRLSALSRLGLKGRAEAPAQPAAAAAPQPVVTATSPRVDLDASYLQEEIQRLITLMEAETGHLKPGSTFAEKEEYVRRHAQLRMLYVIAGQSQLAQQAIPNIDAPTQEFWTSMSCGLATYFEDETIPDPADRITLALQEFRAASQHLQPAAKLEIHSLTFCDRIDGFGNYHPFERQMFRPGQPVLVYAEVRNFQTEVAPGGHYRTSLRSTIEILRNGPDGDLIERKALDPTEDLSRSPRNDYFHSYKLDIPSHLTPGPHTVRLTLEDEISGRIATSTIDFLVK
jgi:hypothetical protein